MISNALRPRDPRCCLAGRPGTFVDLIEALERDERALPAGRLRKKPQHRSRYDTERALGADEQLLEVVAGIVLQHAIHRRDNRAIGQHGLEAEHEIAHHAVAQHVHAAGVRRDVAAYRAAAARAEVERKVAGLVRRPSPALFAGSAPASTTAVPPTGSISNNAVHPGERDVRRHLPGAGSAAATQFVRPPCVITLWPRLSLQQRNDQPRLRQSYWTDTAMAFRLHRRAVPKAGHAFANTAARYYAIIANNGSKFFDNVSQCDPNSNVATLTGAPELTDARFIPSEL